MSLDLLSLLSTYGWEQQILRIRNWKERIILAVRYSIVTRDVNENLTKLQGEGRMVRKKLSRKSDRVTLYAFPRWLVSSKRGLRANFAKRTPISLKEIRRPSTHWHDLTTSGKTSVTRNSVVQPIWIHVNSVLLPSRCHIDLFLWKRNQS